MFHVPVHTAAWKKTLNSLVELRDAAETRNMLTLSQSTLYDPDIGIDLTRTHQGMLALDHQELIMRLPPLSKEQVPPDQRHFVDEITAKRGYLADAFATMLYSPAAAARVAAVGSYIKFESDLDPRLRQLAILVAGLEGSSQYEFSHHSRRAREEIGIPEPVLEAIRDGDLPSGMKPTETSVVRYAQELTRHRKVSDEVFETVLEQLGPAATVDLTVVICYFTMLGYLWNALDVELEPQVEPALPGSST